VKGEVQSPESGVLSPDGNDGKHGTYVLELRAVPGNWSAPGIVRLRRALKCLLRGFGLRCVAIEEKRQRAVALQDASRGSGLPLTEAAVTDLFQAMREAAL